MKKGFAKWHAFTWRRALKREILHFSFNDEINKVFLSALWRLVNGTRYCEVYNANVAILFTKQNVKWTCMCLLTFMFNIGHGKTEKIKLTRPQKKNSLWLLKVVVTLAPEEAVPKPGGSDMDVPVPLSGGQGLEQGMAGVWGSEDMLTAFLRHLLL